jgi:hypothetical protein
MPKEQGEQPGGTMRANDLALLRSLSDQVAESDDIEVLRRAFICLVDHLHESAQYDADAGDMCPD